MTGLIRNVLNWCRAGTSRTLFVLIAVSVMVRIPFLVRPLSGHHEWLTATSFVHVVNFVEQGFSPLLFSPSVSFALPADKNIPFYMNLGDRNGNMYYLSFPPFAFILPAAVFRVLFLPPSVVGLRIFNLILHVLCCLIVYRILVRFLPRGNDGRRAAWAGFAVYLFSPATLWFQSNVYMSDMAVQIFFLAGIWSWLEYFYGDSRPSRLFPRLAVLALANFCMAYTEWIGVFFACAAGLLAVARIRRLGWRRVLPFLAVLAVTTGIPLALTAWQYSLISGWSDLQSYWFSKLTFRTGSPRYASGGLGFTNILAWLNILVNYIGGYLPFLVLAVWLARRQRKKRSASVYSPVMTDAILLSLVPVILHHAVFFNFTSVHDFSVLKSAGVLAILTGLLYHKSLSGRPLKREPALWLGLVAFAVIQFWLINAAGSHSRYRIAGDFIRRESQPDEVVFVTGLPLPADPQYLAYARRNMAGWSGPGQAAELLRKNRTERGVLFSFGADSSVLKTERFVMTNGKIQFKDDR